MAHGCGAHGRSWGAFCGGVEEDARVLVWKERKIHVQQRKAINYVILTCTGTHVGCCIILRLWTSILYMCGRVWWSAGRCWASWALELVRWWVDRDGGGAGATAWPGGWDDRGAWKVWGMRNSPCAGVWGVSWGFPWEWGQAEEDWWCSERVRGPSGFDKRDKGEKLRLSNYAWIFLLKKRTNKCTYLQFLTYPNHKPNS